jgi:NAD(P)H-hydrate epimerase
MKVVYNDDMRQLDQLAIEEFNIPSIVLMENASRVVLEEILKIDQRFHKVIVFAGTGNNGGDGLALARHLKNLELDVVVYIVGKEERLTDDALLNYNILKKLGIEINFLQTPEAIEQIKNTIGQHDLIVDALFGTGLNSEVRDLPKQLIRLINALDNYVVAIDIPSGIDGNLGKVHGIAVKANKTVALSMPKFGNIMYPGSDYNGTLVIRRIGIPNRLKERFNFKSEIITEGLVKQLIPKRKRDSHKGTYGKANVIAGSSGLTGAAILTCKAALRTGVGLLKLYIPESLNYIITTSIPEVVTIPLNELRKGLIGINNFNQIIEESYSSDVIAVGPGCGDTTELLEMIKRIIRETDKPTVIDADGLNALSRNIDVLKEKTSTVVLTPHPGEMSRMTGLSIEEINENPVKQAKKFAKEYNVIMVLKGSRTVIATPEGSIYINTNGNPGMATAGSGDVLTGMITSFIAQGISCKNSAILGVYLHGYTGDLVAKDIGEYGLIAGDIVEGLSKALKVLST